MATKKSDQRSEDKGLMVAAKRESFYSGGQTTPFNFTPRFVPFSDMTSEQEQELRDDPCLIVHEADKPAEPAVQA
jgi:hypothetical protein